MSTIATKARFLQLPPDGRWALEVETRGGVRMGFELTQEAYRGLVLTMPQAEEHALPTSPRTEPFTVPGLVTQELNRLAVLGLVRVPELVRALGTRAGLADIHRVLLAFDDAGVIELRPEAGGQFLPEEDARLCPPGPRGTVFSYAALLRP